NPFEERPVRRFVTLYEKEAEEGSHDEHPHGGHGEKTPISLPTVIASAVLIGAGLFSIIYWLLTFDWLWFGGVFLVLAGALLFFSRRTGLDHSLPAQA
ncbi:MAG: hypothetical protein WCA77_02165, partial [Thermoplasmata archaeon]